MSDKLDDVWSSRDFPVLVAAARLIEGGESSIAAAQLAEAAGMERSQVMLALNGLVPGYLGGEPFDSAAGWMDFFVSDLTERGRRAVGLWPSGEGADALVDALRKAEEATEDAEEKTLLRRAAGAIGSVSRDVMADVLAAYVRQQAGL